MVAVLSSQTVGFLVALAAVIVSSEPFPGTTGLAWGASAGLAGAIGLVAFYGVLANGQMVLGAPLVAVIGAGVPAAVGLLGGDRITAPQGVGLAGGLLAIVIVAWPPRGAAPASAGRRTAVSLPMILLAGLGFAGFFLSIHQALVVSGATWWPLLAARAATVTVGVVLCLTARPAWRGVRSVAGLLVATGVADFGGNAFFLLASRPGYLSVTVVLSSLYPVATVLLATWLLHERLRPWQAAGIALALASVVLIAW